MRVCLLGMTFTEYSSIANDDDEEEDDICWTVASACMLLTLSCHSTTTIATAGLATQAEGTRLHDCWSGANIIEHASVGSRLFGTNSLAAW